MKKFIYLLFVIIVFACNNNNDKAAFVGTWHLVSINDTVVDKGVIIYSTDGQMTAVLSKKDGKVIGYSGKYELNTNKGYVTHFRDFYGMLPYTNDTTVPAYVRDYALSNDKKTLVLSPREEKGLKLTWKKVTP
jgi:hypothetical protein